MLIILLAGAKDAIRNCGAIPDIFNVLSATQIDRIKGLLLGTLLHIISIGMILYLLDLKFASHYTLDRNLPAIRSCGGIPIIINLMSSKPIPLQVASAQIISALSPFSIFPYLAYYLHFHR